MGPLNYAHGSQPSRPTAIKKLRRRIVVSYKNCELVIQLVVNPNAVCIERRRIGIAGVKLGNACCHVVRPILQRKRLKITLHGRYCILSRQEIGDRAKCSLWQSKTKSLVGKEEEGSISTIVARLPTTFAETW